MARLETTVDSAKTVAIDALAFIAGDIERLSRFLALTGINPESVRDAAREPNFLLGVLDYLAGDDHLLRQFADQCEIAPEIVVKAREILARSSPAAP
jgi:hypothetical protein